MIRQIDRRELPACIEVIHTAFSTVAEEFGFTRENCPGYAGFMPLEKLAEQFDKGVTMFGLYERREMIGFVAIEDAGNGVFYLEKLAVLPGYRHKGYGLSLMNFARDAVRERGGRRISIGIVQENTRLKDWYAVYGFRPAGVRKFDHLPFTVGFMELEV